MLIFHNDRDRKNNCVWYTKVPNTIKEAQEIVRLDEPFKRNKWLEDWFGRTYSDIEIYSIELPSEEDIDLLGCENLEDGVKPTPLQTIVKLSGEILFLSSLDPSYEDGIQRRDLPPKINEEIAMQLGTKLHITDKQTVIRYYAHIDDIEHDSSSSFKRIEINEEVLTEVEEDEFDFCILLTEEQYEQERFDKERKFLENACSEIMRQQKIDRVDSFEMLDILEQRLESTLDKENGLKEDGVCAGWGISQDQYFQEKNWFANERTKISEIQHWISQEFPMLYAKWKQLRNK